MRYIRRGIVAVVAFAGLVPFGAPVANATTLVSCTGTETLTFDPPLTNTSTPTRIHFGIDLSTCLGGGVSSGSSAGDFTIAADCTALAVLPPAFADTYTWNTGASSVVTYTAPLETVANGSLVVSDTGTVTAGFDTHAPANETTILPQTALTACATTGVPTLTGPYLLTLG